MFYNDAFFTFKLKNFAEIFFILLIWICVPTFFYIELFGFDIIFEELPFMPLRIAELNRQNEQNCHLNFSWIRF
jgi:hypothetical protein